MYRKDLQKDTRQQGKAMEQDKVTQVKVVKDISIARVIRSVT